MKCLIVLTIALVAVVAANEENKPNQSDIQNDCTAKSGISSEQLIKYNRGDNSDDKEVQDYALCILRQSPMLTEENRLTVDVLVAKLTAAHLDEGIAREIATKCLAGNEQGSTLTEWDSRVTQCLSDNKINELLSEARRKFRENKKLNQS